MKELLKNTPEDNEHRESIEETMALTKKLAQVVNETQRREDTVSKAQEALNRIDDWGTVDRNYITEIVLCDTLTVGPKDNEKETIVLLFERILLICREKGKKRLAVRGHVYIAAITGMQASPSNSTEFDLRVFWKEEEMGCIRLKFRTEDDMKIWKSELEKQLMAARKELSLIMMNNRKKKGAVLKTSRTKQTRSHVSLASLNAPEITSAFDEFKKKEMEKSNTDDIEEENSMETDSLMESTSGANTQRSSMILEKAKTPQLETIQPPATTQITSITAADSSEILKRISLLSDEMRSYILRMAEKENEKTDTFCVKIYFQDDIFLLLFRSIPSLATLRTITFKKIASVVIPGESFNEQEFLELGTFVFKYKDLDNDLINLMDDDDLEIAFRCGKNGLIKIFVSLIEADSDEEDTYE